ncbi:MAG: dTMP kinase [Candidatus Pacebacteria bacterium]|nr:dTMP kinase [Candidatus Paceibacterota bacterium]
MIKNRGKFIVLDGPDGSGKGEVVKRLSCYLFDKSKANNILLTREPYDLEYSAKIREMLATIKKPEDKARVFVDFYAVKDRGQKHVPWIEKELAQGHHVVCDRYKYATLAYQQAQGISFEELMAIHRGMPIPDIAIIIDVPVEVGLERRAKDSGLRDNNDAFEKKEFIEFQEKVRQNYLKLPVQIGNEYIVVIDGNRPKEKVFEAVRQEVDKIF